MPKLAPPNAHTVDSRDTPYLAYTPPPDIVSDELMAAVVKGVTAAFTEIAAAKRKKTKIETTATDGQNKGE